MHGAGIHGVEREKVVEGILNGLTPDTRAFVGKSPVALSEFESEHVEFRENLRRYKGDLLLEFENHRPSDRVYSPIAFTFNFPHNLLKGLLVNAMIEGEGSKVSMNQLLTGLPRNDATKAARLPFVKTLASFAASSPDKVLNKMVPVIGYDPYLGIRHYNKTIKLISEYVADRESAAATS